MSRRPEASAAKSRLRQLLSELRIPPLAYVPLTRSSHLFRHVVRISPDEVGVFVTRERASALLCIEVCADALAHWVAGVNSCTDFCRGTCPHSLRLKTLTCLSS
eukprot:6209516-Pleurochrysis_carterae.AAC.3